MLITAAVFLVINFLALGLGGWLMGQGPSSEWYLNLKKAPLDPPGWVFGVAWGIIMLCFSFYMTELWGQLENYRFLLILFIVQWILNVTWNPVFFRYKKVTAGLILVILLTVLVGFMMIYYYPTLELMTLFILPYFLWMGVAVYLNASILIRN